MRTPSSFAWLVCLTCLGFFVAGERSRLHAADPPQFERDIRPIFREFCYDCHGASETLEGNLDLRLTRFLLQGGDSGPAIVAGDAAASYLIERVTSGEMPPGEAHLPAEKIAVLEAWIAAGAPTLRPEPESIGPGIPISLEERSYWAYQPIERPTVPDLSEHERFRTPIDWLLSEAMPDGLTFAADADRETLIKRASFDLTGLPPTEADMQRLLSLPDDEWFDALLDTMLGSPHYGERWARHWMDVAGYADSEGSTVADAERAWAWKYRDYVIRSLNADKPFDRFVAEQLAGDELAGPKEGEWTPEQIELLTATGFLRMAADGTGSGDNSPEAQNKVIADTLKIVGNALMGMSINCAQCHDHRYDPISHTDYFAVRSVFEPALDWQQWKTPPQRLVSLYTAADREQAAQIEAEAQVVAAEKAAKQTEYMQQALAMELEKFDQPLRAELRAAYETPADKRTDPQKALLDAHPSVNISPGVLYQYLPKAAEDLKTYDQKIAEIRQQKKPEEFLRVLQEPPGHAPLAKLFYRGEYAQPKQDVVPAAVTVATDANTRVEFPVDDPDLPTTGRRLAFAHWLTDRSNPLFARVIVNRVWMHHFGTGIVSTPGDFGKLGTSPTHPKLLDWLAVEFMESGWSLKHLHRVIMSSTAWRQSSSTSAEMLALDPENRWYGRKSLQRLEAETIRDRMLAASGTLDPQLFGPPVAIKEDDTGQVIVDSQTRRSLYVRVRRTQPVAMLQTFDAPVMEINCECRPASTVATQSLMLLNGEFTLGQAKRLADRAQAEATPLADDLLASLPALPAPPAGAWTYGTGRFDETSNQVVDFELLPHWTGSGWQGGAERPAERIGWVGLHADGGHPGNPQFAAVRRWTAPTAGTVTITGKLSHASENGDGVRGRIVGPNEGVLGTWQTHNTSADTPVTAFPIAAGETIDFVTDCLTSETSDSFQWTVTLTLTATDSSERTFDSVAQFHGPLPDVSQLPAHIRRAWQLALCRDPSPDELQLAVAFAAQQLTEMGDGVRGIPSGGTAAGQVLTNVCQMLMNTNEFLYVE